MFSDLTQLVQVSKNKKFFYTGLFDTRTKIHYPRTLVCFSIHIHNGVI